MTFETGSPELIVTPEKPKYKYTVSVLEPDFSMNKCSMKTIQVMDKKGDIKTAQDHMFRLMENNAYEVGSHVCIFEHKKNSKAVVWDRRLLTPYEPADETMKTITGIRDFIVILKGFISEDKEINHRRIERVTERLSDVGAQKTMIELEIHYDGYMKKKNNMLAEFEQKLETGINEMDFSIFISTLSGFEIDFNGEFNRIQAANYQPLMYVSFKNERREFARAAKRQYFEFLNESINIVESQIRGFDMKVYTVIKNQSGVIFNRANLTEYIQLACFYFKALIIKRIMLMEGETLLRELELPTPSSKEAHNLVAKLNSSMERLKKVVEEDRNVLKLKLLKSHGYERVRENMMGEVEVLREKGLIDVLPEIQNKMSLLESKMGSFKGQEKKNSEREYLNYNLIISNIKNLPEIFILSWKNLYRGKEDIWPDNASITQYIEDF